MNQFKAQPRSVSEPVRGEMLDGGILKDYQGSETGEVQFSCQIIRKKLGLK